MLAHQRANALQDIGWNAYPEPTDCCDRISTLECWKYEGIEHVVPGANLVVRHLADQKRQKGTVYSDVETRLRQWLAGKEPYGAPPPPPNAGKLIGGMRVVLCERTARYVCPSISRAGYEDVERKFRLHGATLPTLRLSDGALARFMTRDTDDHLRAIDIIFRPTDKKQVANGIVAVHYDVQRRCTTAWICTAGAIKHSAAVEDRGDIPGIRQVRDISGIGGKDSQLKGRSQLEQLTDAVAGAPALWDHPLLLPAAMLHIYALRAHKRTRLMDSRMTSLEEQLGVTNAGSARPSRSQHWPLDVDPKETMVPLISMLPQAAFMVRCCEWLHEFCTFTETLSAELAREPALSHLIGGFRDVQDSAQYFHTVIGGQKSFYLCVKDRASWQLSLLYSIISQQDGANNRWDSRLNQLIAEATKEDSISVTTFTFITALFLPGTFIATLFSMTMFDWTQDGAGSAATGSSPYVSDKFWIFWIVAVPLTSITMVGWRLWFRYATGKWKTTINNEKKKRDLPMSSY